MTVNLKPLAHPTFDITIPSSQKVVVSRPMVTRERKVLLTALESGEVTSINRAVKEIIDSCIKEIQTEQLTTFDFEWIFLQLVINSIKETMDLEVRIPDRESECDECGKLKRMRVNLRDAKIEGMLSDKKDFLIDVAEGVGLKLKYPTENDLILFDQSTSGKSDFEKMTDLISLCIESVFDESGVQVFSQVDYKSRIDFLESLPIPVTDKLEEFVKTIPKLSLTVTIECPKCHFRAFHQMTGLADFFV